jgi:hypothetical protein
VQKLQNERQLTDFRTCFNSPAELTTFLQACAQSQDETISDQVRMNTYQFDCDEYQNFFDFFFKVKNLISYFTGKKSASKQNRQIRRRIR